jgi:NADH-quinone oxidoreductase subunit N
VQFEVPQLTASFYGAALPIIILCSTGIVALLMAVSKSLASPRVQYWLNFGALLLSLLLVIRLYAISGAASEMFLSGGFVSGRLGFFGQGAIIGIALVISLLMGEGYLKEKFFRGEIIALFHMVIAGMCTMVATDDLVTLFVGLEMASIGVYALIGYTNPTKLSQEGSIKYFVLGAVAAAILLFGFAFLYAATGTLRISEISSSIGKISGHSWVELGAILTIAGLGFKMALVPFHMWTPDAYEGSPTGLTAFMATAMKTMIMVAAIRMFENGLDGVHAVWLPVIGFMAAASLLFANIMALAQQSVKRMLAYSSIAHSGYMALALASMSGGVSQYSVPSILFYLIGYVLVSLGAFAVIMWLENERCENIIVDDLTGLAKQHPYAATALALFMFSLGGMPPTVGFISKLYIFNSALSNNMIGLIVVAAIGSTISLYYYMRIIVRMFMMDSSPVLGALIKPVASKVTSGVVLVCAILIILFGTLLPESGMRVARHTSGEVTGGL